MSEQTNWDCTVRLGPVDHAVQYLGKIVMNSPISRFVIVHIETGKFVHVHDQQLEIVPGSKPHRIKILGRACREKIVWIKTESVEGQTLRASDEIPSDF